MRKSAWPDIYLNSINSHLLVYSCSCKSSISVHWLSAWSIFTHHFCHSGDQIQICTVFMFKQPTGGHFEILILTKLHPNDMYSVFIVLRNMLTHRSYSVVTMVINRQIVIYSSKIKLCMVAILNFRYLLSSFLAYLSPIPTFEPNIKKETVNMCNL